MRGSKWGAKNRTNLRAAVRSTVERLEGRTLLTAVSWTGQGDGATWTDPKNWSTGAVPTASDDVTINVTAGTTITAGQSIAAHSLTDNANLSLTDAHLTISGGGLTLSGGAVVSLSSNNIASFLDFVGTESITGAGSVVFNGSAPTHLSSLRILRADPNPAVLTIGSGITVATGTASGQLGGAGQGNTSLVNQGTISAATQGTSIRAFDPIQNQGTVQASNGATADLQLLTTSSGTLAATGGATLSLEGTWSNTGTIIENAATLSLGGSFTQAAVGTLQRTGGTINLAGTLTGDLALTPATGSWNLVNATLMNGTYAGTGGAVLVPLAGTLDGYTLASDLTVTDAQLAIRNGLTLANNANLTLIQNNATTGLAFVATQTLGGQGRVTFSGSGPAHAAYVRPTRNSATPSILTIGSGITVATSGGGGFLGGSGQGNTQVVNQGTILQQTAGSSLNFLDPLLNQGTIDAEAGTVLFSTDWTNAATVTVNNATLTLGTSSANGTNTGTITVANSTVNLGGALTQAQLGTLNRSGGTVNLVGTLSGDLTLTAATGSWVLAGGTLVSGTYTATGGAALLAGTGTFDDYTLANDLNVTDSQLNVLNGLTLANNATVSLSSINGGCGISFSGTQTIGGGGQIVFNGSRPTNNSFIRPVRTSAQPANLTIAPGITVKTGTASGTIGGSGQGNTQIINQGTILDQTAGASLAFLDLVTNQSTIDAEAGTLSFNSDWTNDATIIANNATLILGTGSASPTNTGTINVTNSVVNLGGALTQAKLGTINRTGGTVNLVGTLSGDLSLTAATGSWTLANGTLVNGTYAATGGATLLAGTGTFDGYTLASDLTVTDSQLNVLDGLTLANNSTITLAAVNSSSGISFTGTQTLGGAGQLVFSGSRPTNSSFVRVLRTSAQPATLTLAPGITIKTGTAGGQIGGSGQGNTQFVNQGKISAETSGTTISLLDPLVNQGTLQTVTGAILTVQAAITNTGTLAVNVGTLNLAAPFKQSDLGTISRTGGTVNVTGTVTGNVALDATTGSWNFNGNSKIVGGTITEAGGAQLVATNLTLDGCTLASDLTTAPGGTITVYNGLTLANNATLTLDGGSGAAQIAFVDTQTLGGAGQIVFNANSPQTQDALRLFRSGATGATLTIAPGITVRTGTSGMNLDSGGLNGNQFINQGTISAQTAGTNLQVFDPLVNQGALQVLDGASLGLFVTLSNTGTLTLNNGTLNLAGTFTQADLGTLVRTGGTINLTGTLNGNLSLDAGTGSWNLKNGQLVNGTLTLSGGFTLNVTTGTFDHVTLASDLILAAASVTVRNGLTLSGGSTLTLDGSGNSAALNFQESQTLGGVGQVVLNGSAANQPGGFLHITRSQQATATLTVGPQVVIHSGTSGGVIDSAGQSGTVLENDGTISVQTAGATLQINLPMHNAGSITSTAGTVQIGANNSTADLGSITASQSGVVLVSGTIDNTNATLALSNATGPWDVSGTIKGGTITEAAGDPLRLRSNSTLDGVTLASDTALNAVFVNVLHGLTLANGATLSLNNVNGGGAVLSFTDTQAFGGTGQVLFNGLPGTASIMRVTHSANPTATLTVGPGITISTGTGGGQIGGSGQNGTLILNQGTILQQTGGATLTVADPLDNQGTFRLTTGTVELRGTYTTAQIGSLQNQGGTVNIDGTIDNTNATLAFTPTTGSWVLNNGTIKGGTITQSGGAALVLNNFGTLDGVTLASDFDINGGQYQVRNDLTLANGVTLSLTGNASRGGSFLDFYETQTLGGTGHVVFNADMPSRTSFLRVLRTSQPAATLTVGPSVSIATGTASGQIGGAGQGGLSFVLEGSVSVPTAGTSLAIRDPFQNQGTLTVGSGATVNLIATETTAGLGNVVNTSGGTFVVSGTLDNTNSTLALSPSTGPFQITGTLLGGTVTETGGTPLVIANGSTLDGVTIASDTTISAATVNVKDGLTLANGATLSLNATAAGYGALVFADTQTLGGNGTVSFTGLSNPNEAIRLQHSTQPTMTLTIGPGVTVQTGSTSGVLGGSGQGGTQLVNQGTIAATVANTSITILDPFQNQGNIVQANGGVVNINAGGALVFSSGNVNLSGNVTATSIQVTGGNVAIDTTSPLTLTTLTITGGMVSGSTPITVTGIFNWTGGTLAGTGSTTIASGGSVAVAGQVTASRPFSNAGTVNVSGGSLELDGGGTQTGTFSVANGATLAFGGSSTETIGGSSTLSGAGSVQFQSAVNATVSGAYNVSATTVQDTAAVDFTGPATTGTLNVNGGSLTIGGVVQTAPLRTAVRTAPLGGVLNVLTKSVFGDGTTTVLPNWTLNSTGPLLFVGPGNPTIVLTASDTSPGTLMLGGDVSFTASTGAAAIRSTGTGAQPGLVDLGGGSRSFTIAHGSSPTDVSIAARVTDGSLRKAGSGSLQLASANTYAGGTTISNGTLELDDSNAAGSGPITVAGGMLALRNGANPSNPLSVLSSDTISLDVGTSNLSLPTPALGSNLTVLGSAGGSLTLTGDATLAHDLVINNAVPVTINGSIGGNFGITKTGAGALTLGGSAANTYTGPTEVVAGTLVLNKTAGLALPGSVRIDGPGAVQLQHADQLPATASVTFDATSGIPTLDLNGFNQTLAALVSFQPGAGAVRLGTGKLTLHYGAGPSPDEQIRSFIASGALTAAGYPAVAYADGADGVVAGLAAGDCIVRGALPGDVNLDGTVNFSDLLILAQHYNVPGGAWTKGDFNADAKVNFTDLLSLAQNYNHSVTPAKTSAVTAASLVDATGRPQTRSARKR